MANGLFSWACGEIATAESQLGHQLSWRFLTTPARTLSKDARIAFMALNPGGDHIPKGHAKESCETGPAHICANWRGAVIQEQVRALFQSIASALGVAKYEDLMSSSLMAYFIPFRSPNIGSLRSPKETKEFAFCLWSHILPQLSPDLIISLGWGTFFPLHSILMTVVGLTVFNERRLKTGWGNVRARVSYYTWGADEVVVLVGLPHLSRYSIFRRAASAPYVEQIVREMTKHMKSQHPLPPERHCVPTGEAGRRHP